MRHVKGESNMKEYADKTALIVDDDPDFLEQLEIQLNGLGFNVVAKDTQEAAQAYIQDHRPDIAFLDLMMENMDAGFVLSYAVKKRHPETPVVLVTAVSSETGLEFDATTRDERSWIKADVILSKPVRLEQLKKQLQDLLRDRGSHNPAAGKRRKEGEDD